MTRTEPAQVKYTKRLKLFNVACVIIETCAINLAGFITKSTSW